jgi:hypothetical protein
MPEQLSLFKEVERVFDTILVPYNEPIQAKLWRALKKVIFGLIGYPIFMAIVISILGSVWLVFISIVIILSTTGGEIENELRKLWLEKHGMDPFPMVWLLITAALFITLAIWIWYQAKKDTEKEIGKWHKYWDDLDKLDGGRSSKIERDILHEAYISLPQIETNIVADYGKILEMTPGLLRPLSTLPYPKAAIRAAIERLLSMVQIPKYKEALQIGLFALDDFVPDDEVPPDKAENRRKWLKVRFGIERQPGTLKEKISIEEYNQLMGAVTGVEGQLVAKDIIMKILAKAVMRRWQ